jgi:hypothetical protein
LRPLNITDIQHLQPDEQLANVHLLKMLERGKQMVESELSNSNTPSKKKLNATLQTVRRSSWKKYLQIMLLASIPSGATMNEVSMSLGEKPQTVHPLLKRMIDRTALNREKRGIEYYYYLSPDITKEDVEIQLKEIADGATDSMPLLDLDDEVPEQNQPKTVQLQTPQVTDMNTQEVSSKSDREEISNKKSKLSEDSIPKLPDLPEYNPNWSEERQNRWFDLYEKILEERRRKDND